jgi:hypothetical protein
MSVICEQITTSLSLGSILDNMTDLSYQASITSEEAEVETSTQNQPKESPVRGKMLRRKSNERFQNDSSRDVMPSSMPVRRIPHLSSSPQEIGDDDSDLFDIDDDSSPPDTLPRVGSNKSLSSLISAITLDSALQVPSKSQHMHAVFPPTYKKAKNSVSMSPPTKPLRRSFLATYQA